MSAPRLTRPLWLQAMQATPDGAGGFQTAWGDLGMLWAEVKNGSGRATSGEGGAVSSMSHRIVVRAAPVGASSRPLPGQRFVDETGTFLIKAVSEYDPMGRFLVCFTQQEVAL